MSSNPNTSNSQSRGVKRNHADTECTDSCDCEEFGMPLAKKINQMNIEYDRLKMAQDNNRASVSPSDDKSPSVVHPEPDPDFVAKYPFSQESHYYSSNLLLSRLYLERIQRNPHLKHDPSEK